MLGAIKHFLIGAPFPSSLAQTERLAIPLAFVIISSNALSSVAYASEEISIVLTRQGAGALRWAPWVALAVALLAFIVVISYRQVVRAYPGGGGAYVVARENLRPSLALIAAAGLLVDYVLTVSVSVTAGVASLGSVFPLLVRHKVGVSVLAVTMLMLLNMRGVRESGRLLAMPVYVFIVSLVAMVATGLWHQGTQGGISVFPWGSAASGVGEGVGFLLLLRAFSAGCIILTGLEAISNTVDIFKLPAARNAQTTQAILGAVLVTFFLGVTFLAYLLGISQGVGEGETLISKVARGTFGDSWLYHLVMWSTSFILFVAANTSFSAFPRLASVLARDGYLARPIANLGDRLVYSNGIVLLAALSILLIVVFQGTTHYLLPLYAVGVFVGFTLAQTGMVIHWWRKQERGWQRAMGANGIGAVVTLIVLLVLVVTKFSGGAWVVVVVIPLLLWLFSAIRNHYRKVAEALSLQNPPEHYVATNLVILPLGGVHRAVVPALEYAKAIGTTVRAVHVAVDAEAARLVEARWNRLRTDVPLTIIPSPYRSVIYPLMDFIRAMLRQHPTGYITVVIPEFVPRRWWEQILHNQTAAMLKLALLYERRVIVVDVPYHLQK